jgi:hypothetical protein
VKLRGHIQSVAANGGYLEIELKLAAVSEAEGTWLREARLSLPNNKSTRDALMVERYVALTLELL